MPKARYIMIGGFLGAGKTTSILRLGHWLEARKLRVGLITNDQSIDLVDTARVRAEGFAVEEITGGCFCCRFNSLVAASQQLTQSTAPDVLIAEPVGSCTDLKATVSYPLRQLYGENYSVAPLSVLVDPVRCARILGLETGGNFSEKVLYVYRKQLEEAEILVINKIDMLDPAARTRLTDSLKRAFPRATVMQISSKTGDGLDAWFERITSDQLGHDATMDVDYDIYADGEALLGWVNARGPVTAPADFDGNAFVLSLTQQLRDRLVAQKIEVAHLKMTLAPNEGIDLAAISLTRSDGAPQPTHSLTDPISEGDLMINLRAEADPQILRTTIESVAKSFTTPKIDLQTISAFRPGRPNPTHRVAVKA